MKITFLGDIMAEPPVLKAAKGPEGYDFSGVFAPAKALLAQSDYVVANLETPLAGKEAGYTDTHLAFNAPDEYADALLEAGVKLVSTANNYTFDRGYAGMERTIRVLDEKGLPHTGSFLPGEKRPEAYYFKQDGTKFAVIATHSHIPQKMVRKNGVPCAYCLGNYNMNPRSYLAMPEILTHYGYAVHLYVVEKGIVKVTFSMMKNCVMPDGQIASYPVDELYKTLRTDKEKKTLEKEIRHLYGRITGRVLEGEIVQREYAM